mmetsp:Transcript_63297/g.133506  ORF Transcript_63297/g.133506 Transcript_63297/m.133506 type:complete len:203 (+) Transcript_63297:110-718(+)
MPSQGPTGPMAPTRPRPPTSLRLTHPSPRLLPGTSLRRDPSLRLSRGTTSSLTPTTAPTRHSTPRLIACPRQPRPHNLCQPAVHSRTPNPKRNPVCPPRARLQRTHLTLIIKATRPHQAMAPTVPTGSPPTEAPMWAGQCFLLAEASTIRLSFRSTRKHPRRVRHLGKTPPSSPLPRPLATTARTAAATTMPTAAGRAPTRL